jgi:F-box/leucine-rich repeat protein 2/20
MLPSTPGRYERLRGVRARARSAPSDTSRIDGSGRWRGEESCSGSPGCVYRLRFRVIAHLFVRQVSRAWQDLAFDGQLWKNTDFHEAIGHLPPSSLIALLARNQGAYIRNLALNGWRNIPPHAFAFAMINNGGRSSRAVVTTLEKLDLQGCASLDSRTLEAIIENSPNLKWLSLRGNRRVTDDVVRAISFHADQLEYLDLSRCRSISLMDDGGIDEDNSWPALKTLKLCGGPVESGLLGLLASAAPNLETLDISYSVDIDDEEIKEFTALPAEKYNQALALAKASANGSSPLGILADSVMLTPAQAGELGSAFPCDGLVPRRVTKLRHLNLSNCPNITQKAAAYLAYAVPHLEILEMASVGEMTSDGLVALLETTPKIRKVDLEGATRACDRVLAALTPPTTGKASTDASPGRELEAFAIGHASQITNDGALKLLRACPKLVQVNFEVSIAHRSSRGHS